MIKTILIDNSTLTQDLSLSLKKMNDIGCLNVFKSFQEFFDSSLDINEINLIIFDIKKDNQDEILDSIKDIQKENKSIKFIALSSDLDKTLLSRTLDNNVSDFLFKPIIPALLEASIKKLNFSAYETSSTIKKAKTISLFSLKGGVGKTSCAINLAFEIQEKTKKNVCLLDFNLNSSDCTLFLDLKSQNSIDNLIQQFEQLNKESALNLIPRYKDSSLFVLPIKDENSFEIKINPAKTTRIINSLKNIFDYIIIDTSSNYDENNLAVLGSCDLILYLTTLSQATVQSTCSIFETFTKIGYNQNKIKLILNRYSENSQISLEDFEKEANKEVFARIPNNYLTMSDAINQASPLKLTNPQSNVAKAFLNLAGLIDNLNIQEESLTKEYNHGIYNIIHRMGE